MRSKKEIEKELLSLKIEKMFANVFEVDGEKQKEDLKQFEEYKSTNNKFFIKIKTKNTISNLGKSFKNIAPKVCTAMMAIIIFFTTILATNETAYAYALKILQQHSVQQVEVTVPKTQGEIVDFFEVGYYMPTYLPDGYIFVSTEVNNSYVLTQLMNVERQSIYIQLFLEEVNLIFDNETVDVYEHGVDNGNEYLYNLNIEKNTSSLIYLLNGVTIKIISDDISFDELLKIAKNLEIFGY